eukprot:scaffold32148_cov154-Skeletonema_menzelii.AAC.4
MEEKRFSADAMLSFHDNNNYNWPIIEVDRPPQQVDGILSERWQCTTLGGVRSCNNMVNQKLAVRVAEEKRGEGTQTVTMVTNRLSNIRNTVL